MVDRYSITIQVLARFEIIPTCESEFVDDPFVLACFAGNLSLQACHKVATNILSSQYRRKRLLYRTIVSCSIIYASPSPASCSRFFFCRKRTACWYSSQCAWSSWRFSRCLICSIMFLQKTRPIPWRQSHARQTWNLAKRSSRSAANTYCWWPLGIYGRSWLPETRVHRIPVGRVDILLLLEKRLVILLLLFVQKFRRFAVDWHLRKIVYRTLSSWFFSFVSKNWVPFLKVKRLMEYRL